MSFSSNNILDESKMDCISRRDDKDKNIFIEGNESRDRKKRWNLYSQIAIENDKLICAKEAYDLTDICYTEIDSKTQRCTLLDTNEVVDIGNGPYL